MNDRLSKSLKTFALLKVLQKAQAHSYKVPHHQLAIEFLISDKDLSHLEKTAPEYAGQSHPDPYKPWTAKVHPEGQLMWHANEDQARRTDATLNNPHAIQKFLQRVPQSHREPMSNLINMTAKDPNRHFIPVEDNGKMKLRARHIRSLLFGGGDVTMDTSEPNVLRITRNSHSEQKAYPPIHMIYRFGDKNGIRKAEKNDRSATYGHIHDVFLRSRPGTDIQSGRNILHPEQDSQEANASSNDRGYIGRLSRLYKAEMKRHLEKNDFFKSWEDSYKTKKTKKQPMTLVHYSRHPGLKAINSDNMGNGTGGEFSRHFNPSKIKDFPRTSFHYIQDTPEDIVKMGANAKYLIHLHPDTELYDLSKDPDGFVKQTVPWNYENLLNAVKGAGYDGLWSSDSDHPVISNTVQLFNEHPVAEEMGVNDKIEQHGDSGE